MGILTGYTESAQAIAFKVFRSEKYLGQKSIWVRKVLASGVSASGVLAAA
jgi:hypothetical protein